MNSKREVSEFYNQHDMISLIISTLRETTTAMHDAETNPSPKRQAQINFRLVRTTGYKPGNL